MIKKMIICKDLAQPILNDITFQYQKYNNNIKIVYNMGNVQPSIYNNRSNLIDIASPHIMLNNCKQFVRNKHKYILSEWNFIDKKDYIVWHQRYMAFLGSTFYTQNQNEIKQPVYKCLFLPFQHSYSAINSCSSNGVVSMSYEMVEESLVKQIENRALSNEPYTQHQIWAILLFLVTTISYLHQKHIFIGDVRPENIFIASEGGLKIANQYSWIQHQSLRTKFMDGIKMFLTKQSMAILNNQQLPFNVGSSNDGFGIGMTIAECILLEDISGIYPNLQPKIINQERHKNIINQLLNIKYYPLQLIILVIGMIQLESSQRFSCEEVNRCLQAYKVDILAEKQISLGKEGFKKFFGHKYIYLKDFLVNQKHMTKGKLFTKGDLSLSFGSSRINGISTVQMMKRTDNDTFNISFPDFNETGVQILPFKTSQASSNNNNKSWANADYKRHFNDRKKNSNVLDQYYNYKTKKYSYGQKQIILKIDKMDEEMPMMLQSDVKQMTFNRKYLDSGTIENQELNQENADKQDERIVKTSQRQKLQQKSFENRLNIQQQINIQSKQKKIDSIPHTNNNSLEDCIPDAKIQDQNYQTISFSFDEVQQNNKNSQRFINLQNMSIQQRIFYHSSMPKQPQSYLSFQYSNSKSSKKGLRDLSDEKQNNKQYPLEEFLQNLRAQLK